MKLWSKTVSGVFPLVREKTWVSSLEGLLSRWMILRDNSWVPTCPEREWMRKKWGERSIPRGPEGPVTARSHERLHGYSWGDLSTFGRPPLLWITFAGLQAQGPPWVFLFTVAAEAVKDSECQRLRNTRVLEDSPTIHTSLPMVSQPLAAAVSAVETSGSRGVREWDKGFLLGEI